MKEVGKILTYCALVVVGAALLAPPLWWAGQWAIAQDIIPQLRPFGFPKYFNRAALVLALGLLWPVLRWLGLTRWTDLHLTHNPWRWRDLLLGALLGAGGLTLVTALLVGAGDLSVHDHWAWSDIWSALLTGVVVATIEEVFFRGALLGVLRRNLPWPRALLFLSLFFAVLHFVRSDPAGGRFDEVTWASGLTLLPQLFWQFGHLDLVLGTWITLLLVGWTLGYTVVRTSSLYMAIGMHAGWVSALKLLMSWTDRRGSPSIWVGEDLRSGLVPACLVFATFMVLAVLLRRRGPPEQASL